jgi:lipoprotein-anchoring transpeptidase ErfK/SrfK
MHSPRSVTAASTALLLAATMPQLAQAREIVGFSGAYSSGTVVVKTTERALYYVLGNGKAVRYPVGVGRRGKQWTGTAFITSKQLRPRSPTERQRIKSTKRSDESLLREVCAHVPARAANERPREILPPDACRNPDRA